jgi:hypothetical protein
MSTITTNARNWFTQSGNGAYGRTFVPAAVLMHDRACTRVLGIDGTDLATVAAARPATAKGPRTWSPPNT